MLRFISFPVGWGPELRVENTKMMGDELLYFKNKIEEETMNITLWVEKIQKVVASQIEIYREAMMINWNKY